MSLRVFELARELNTPAKDLLARISGLEFNLTGNFSVLTDAQVKAIRKEFLEPASRIQEKIVSDTQGEKKVRRRIISIKKAEASLKIKKSLHMEDVPLKEDIQTRKDMSEVISVKDEKIEDKPEEVLPKQETLESKKPKVSAPEIPKETIINIAEVPQENKKVIETTKVELHNKATSKIQENKIIEEEKPVIPKKTRVTVIKSYSADDDNKITSNDIDKKNQIDTKTNKEIKGTTINESGGNKDFGEKKRNRDNGLSGKKRYGKWVKKKEVKSHSQKIDQNRPKHTFEPRKKGLIIGDSIVVGELASIIGVKVSEIIKSLMSLDCMATITQSIDGETAALVASEHGIELKVESKSFEHSLNTNVESDSDQNNKVRSPVVTIMGHVDHGKTSLLDKIRSTNVTGAESGGITQHIGAYFVETETGAITFLDTPGHEAFSAMRARGSNITDIVILVVAADDGPRPQTVEAINHALAANVPISVAVNKCDKQDADPLRCTKQLMEHGLISEEFGGETPMINVSATTGEGIPKLMEMLQLQAEIMELKANPDRPAQGVVIESRIDRGRGNVISLLVQNGTLKVGDNCVVGAEFGRIRAIWNDKGKKVKVALPSHPVEIVGINGLPNAGDRFNSGKDEKQVRQIANERVEKKKQKVQIQLPKKTLENLFDDIEKTEQQEINLIIKTDVAGSMEALSESLLKLSNEEVEVKIIHSAVGGISLTDVTLATASKATIIGFNVRPDPSAKKMAQEEGIDVRSYSIIYEVIDDLEKAIKGMLKPIIREELQGKAEVMEVYTIPKVGTIAGTKVISGKIVRNCQVRVIRDSVVIHDGSLASLKRFKDDAKEVSNGFECGIGITSYKDLRVGDILESYQRITTPNQG